MLSKFIYLNSIRGNIHFLDPALYLLISIYWNGLPFLRSLRCFLLSLRSHQVIVAVSNDIRVPVVFHLLEWTAVFTESEMLPPLIESIKGIVAVTNDIRVPVVDCCVVLCFICWVWPANPPEELLSQVHWSSSVSDSGPKL